MGKKCLYFAVVLTAQCALASWWWPFGGGSSAKPRMSDLLEPASILIDNASDFAEDGKVDEAIAEYRKALAELDRVELENPDRVDKPEFASLKSKRAYANSAIDSLLLKEARANSKKVVMTDTAALEKEYSKRVEAAKNARSGRPGAEANTDILEVEGVRGAPAVAPAQPQAAKKPITEAVEAFKRGDKDGAKAKIAEILKARPGDVAALNLLARVQMAEKDYTSAERTLYRCTQANPRSYYAYYNMARVVLAARDDKEAAALYYKTGRAHGGPVDSRLEALATK